jgi:hypothetical protein
MHRRGLVVRHREHRIRIELAQDNRPRPAPHQLHDQDVAHFLAVKRRPGQLHDHIVAATIIRINAVLPGNIETR